MNWQILGIIILLLIYSFRIYWKRIILPKIKGSAGEYKVAIKLRKLPRNNYLILNDLLLKNGEYTTQIDHVVISLKGIFILETKNYKGWIHGHEKSEYWTQTIFKQKTKFRNPIKQNWAHLYALKNSLAEYPNITYYPVVIFDNGARLMNITSQLPVLNTKYVRRFIKNTNGVQNLSFEQMQDIYNKLSLLNIKDRKERKKHKKQVKSIVVDNRIKQRAKLCPKCSGTLVLRNGKYGKFYGCSNFPNCRYTLK